jgi:hypothetical protein
MPRELINFFGIGNSKSSFLWSAIRYSRENAIKRLQKVEHLLTEETLDWCWEFLSDKDISISGKSKWLMNSAKKYISRDDTIHTLPDDPTPTTPSPTRSSYGPKVVHMHIYPCMPKYGIKEGMLYLIAMEGDKVIKSAQYFSMSTEDLKSQATLLAKQCQEKGWDVNILDMCKVWNSKFGKYPRYTEVRKLWNDVSDYAKKVLGKV